MEREEAINNLKKALGFSPTYDEAFYTLFPEFRVKEESEDERIKKGIINFLLYKAGHLLDEETEHKFLVYLEKQKPVEWNDTDMKEARDNLISVCRDWERGEPTTLIPIVAVRARYFLEHLTEPKPAEWSEEDEDMRDTIIRDLKRLGGDIVNVNPAYKPEIDWLKSLPERFNLPPKQEWSKEDEGMLNCIIATLCEESHGGRETNDKMVTWLDNRLKSLRPQPQEEIYQAAKHDLAIKFMNYLDENRPEGKMGLSNSECEDIDKAFKENSWEKIMRYANKYSWKPSEEQMKALKEVAYNIVGTGTATDIYLVQLYEQLKKLI